MLSRQRLRLAVKRNRLLARWDQNAGRLSPGRLIVLTIAARELSEPSCRGSVIAAD